MRAYVCTITEEDVRHPLSGPIHRKHGVNVLLAIQGAMGRFLRRDVGKRVYRTQDSCLRDVYQVENDEQRDRRLARKCP